MDVDVSMEEISPIMKIKDLGFETFIDIPKKEEFRVNIRKIGEAIHNLKLEDLELDPALVAPETWASPDKAPCTFVEVITRRTFTLGMFIVKPGFKIPLHNHAGMYGFVKVLQGSMTINTYSPCAYKDLQEIDLTPYMKVLNQQRRIPHKYGVRKYYARVHSSMVYDVNSPTSFVTPIRGNYHDIETHNELVIFLDVVSPSYDTLNICKYFKINQRMADRFIQLEETPPPKEFFCDFARYSNTPEE